MKNVLPQKHYYHDEDGQIDKLYNALDCFEQIEYQVLKKYNYQYSYAFCNDINPIYVIKKNQHRIYPNNIIKQNLFMIEHVFVKEDNYFEIIQAQIDKGNLVAYKTLFDLLPPFIWNYEDAQGIYDDHFSTIVGYDSEHYYFMDSPGVLFEERNIRYNQNHEISLIKKEVLHSAFKKLCKLRVIYVNQEELVKKVNVFTLIESMIECYNSLPVYGEDTSYLGRRAYYQIIKGIFSEDYDFLMDNFLSNHWYIHLLCSRRIILKMCLEKEDEFLILENSKIILDILNSCIELWSNFKEVVIKNDYKPFQNYKEVIVQIIINILAAEDSLFYHFKVLMDKYKLTILR